MTLHGFTPYVADDANLLLTARQLSHFEESDQVISRTFRIHGFCPG
jgi:hypothetical protein